MSAAKKYLESPAKRGDKGGLYEELVALDALVGAMDLYSGSGRSPFQLAKDFKFGVEVRLQSQF